jgi:hypothetical protein
VRGTDRPFNGEYAYAPWPVDLSYGFIGCREPYNLDRGSSPTMTSALRDAGIGVEGGYPWIVPTLPTAVPTSVSIACVSFAWTARIGRPGPANSTNKPDESAIHSMKEKQQ